MHRRDDIVETTGEELAFIEIGETRQVIQFQTKKNGNAVGIGLSQATNVVAIVVQRGERYRVATGKGKRRVARGAESGKAPTNCLDDVVFDFAVTVAVSTVGVNA